MIHNVPQPDFERFVAEKLAFDTNVELRKGVAFVCCEQRGDRVITTVEERVTKKRWAIASNYVIGCDGAKSEVRKSLNIETEGEDGYETMMTIHFNADLRPIVKERVGMLHWIVDPACSGFIIAYDLGGNQVLISNFDSNKHPAEAWSEDLARATVTAAIGKDIPFKILSYRPWVLSRKVAQEYRRGNTFLLGDAAHSFPPTGGLGLNSGLADAHNLVYKIAAVHQGWAKPSILDTYEADRRRIALVASSQSVKNGKTIFSFLKAVGTAGIENVDEARANMYKTIHDPAKEALIAQNVEGQREHFDNTVLNSRPRPLTTLSPRLKILNMKSFTFAAIFFTAITLALSQLEPVKRFTNETSTLTSPPTYTGAICTPARYHCRQNPAKTWGWDVCNTSSKWMTGGN
ncbi:hypothetical protein K4K57_009289 [Colletotrichum sp. SAR 10_99]|nr:hypothetical protein K4K57_009289 [Colletotrichum sp. SAR 10_99]